MNIDLNDLRIQHRDEGSPPGVSRLWIYLFFALLIASAAAIVYLLEFDPRAQEQPKKNLAAGVVKPRPADPRPGAKKETRGAFSAAGWIKLPLRYPVLVTPLVEGRLEKITVVEGDPVAANQEIAHLYDKDFKAALDAAEAKVREAGATLEKLRNGYRPQEVAEARADVESLEAELKTAREVLAHSQELQPSGAISQEEVLRDATQVKTLTASLARKRQRLALMEEGFRREEIDLAGAGLERARAERDLARLRLGYAVIRSPIKGVVIERKAEVGQWITPRDGAIVALYDPADLEARIDVDQDDLAKVFEGQDVELTTRVEPGRVLAAKVVLIEPRADQVKNTVSVRVKITKPQEGRLHPDMVVKARFLPGDQPQ